MTIVTKGMGAIIKGITKGTKTRNEASKKMFKDAVRKIPLKNLRNPAERPPNHLAIPWLIFLRE